MIIQGGQLQILSKDQIEKIHYATLDILQNIGIFVQLDEARKILKDAGADVDEKTRIVKFPEYLVMEAVRKAPTTFTIYARNKKKSIKIAPKNVYFEPMIGRINILDMDTGKRRRTNIKDVANLIKIADAMENYQILHSGAMMPHIEGVPEHASHVYGYLEGVRNSDKIVKGTGRGIHRAKDCLKMASIIAGGEEELRKRPIIFTTSNTISPLQLHSDQLEGLIEYSKMGQPLDIASEPQAGATAPATLAGLLAQQTAEVLAGVTITQLVNPGAPVFYGTVGTVMDMKVGYIAIGAIEMGIINVATAQLARFYGLPVRGTASATDSKVLDMQAGYEKALTTLMAALAGINTIFYPGTIEQALTISLESLVIDNEIAGMVYRALKGIEVNEDTLALDILEKVGPGGHFLGQRHTLDHIKTEHFLPKLSNRIRRDMWEAAGSKDIWAVAKEEVGRILKEHTVEEPLDPDVEKELEEYVKMVVKRGYS
ncbi:MAG: trimethylamine methyltransferase family protein [Candidatus Odinarchaeota archaeon]|nr:trimethylamine methyltransferase family protein [Candidatus Odinarchaeota archaeon]